VDEVETVAIAETGHIVVYKLIVLVVMDPTRQFTTVAAQRVTV
jgi:hypothetical protein